MRDDFIKTLTDIVSKNKKIILVTADLGFGVLDEFIKKFPKNFLNVGVAEQNMIGIATGLSKKGFNVFVYSIGNFPTLRCLEQIRNDAVYHESNVKIVTAGAGYSYGQLGFSHHATEDVSIMNAIPELKIISPYNSFETIMATKYLAENKGTFYFRLDKKRANKKLETNKEISNKFLFGKISKILNGKDLAIFSYGGILNDVIEICNNLKSKNIKPTLLSCHSLKPLDKNGIKKICRKFKKIFVIEENSLIGGLGSEISRLCLENNINPHLFKTFGIKDKFIKEVGDRNHLLEISKIDKKYCLKKILSYF
jgi:transketolase